VEELIIFAFSALLGLGCFAALGWIAINPETLDVDKIFSIIACLLLGLTFLGFCAWMLFKTNLRKLWQGEKAATPQPAVKAAPKKAAVPEEVGKPAS